MTKSEEIKKICNESEAMKNSQAAAENLRDKLYSILPKIASAGYSRVSHPFGSKSIPDLEKEIYDISHEIYDEFKYPERKNNGSRQNFVRSIFLHLLEKDGFEIELDWNWDKLTVIWGFNFQD